MFGLRHVLGAVVLLGTIACGTSGSGDPQWEAQTRTDQGLLCVDGEADADATITVTGDFCLSSSCDRNATGSCSASVDGTTITVTSSFDWEEATGNVDCTDDCGSVDATCTVGPLAAGSYTVVHGGGSTTIDIPATREGDCGG